MNSFVAQRYLQPVAQISVLKSICVLGDSGDLILQRFTHRGEVQLRRGVPLLSNPFLWM